MTLIPQFEVGHEVAVSTAGDEEDERIVVLEVVEVTQPDLQQRVQQGLGRDREHAAGRGQPSTGQT